MKLLDSSIWLAHIVEAHPRAIALIESEEVLLCTLLSLFEIRKRLKKDKFSESKIQHILEFIKQRATVVNLTEEIATKAADFSLEHDLSALDSLLYASAVHLNALFITADNDFRGLKNVEVIDR